MRAVTFNVSVPGFVLGKTLGRVSEAALFGGLSGLSYGEVGEPGLPGDDWVRLEVIKAGICGSDIGTLTFKSSPAMEPFSSFPAVLGHEVLARVAEVGAAVRRVQVGQRVAVDPVISCTMRGFSGENRCPSCSSGLHATCARSGDGGETLIAGRELRPGLTVGYQADLAGGWSERMIAHESQLFPLDDRISDSAGVLMEPLAVGMHAALRSRPFGDGPTLVIGSGPIALGTIWALRATGYEGELVAQIKRGHEADIARALGASDVISPGDEARQSLVDTGSSAYMPIIGDEVYAGGGFPLIFDCVGSGQTIKQALRYAAPRGEIVMLGCAAEVPKLDLTFVWARELRIQGYVCYGLEEWRGERLHTFQITHDMLLETGAPVQRMVTHDFPLAQYRDAVSTAANRRRTGSIKVLLDSFLDLSAPKVVVVGGGVIGISCAYYLARGGADVVVLERERIGAGASGGNAGTVSPGHPPLNKPGRVAKALRQMLDPTSPLYIRPSFNPSLWRWLMGFTRHCTTEHVEACMSVMAPLGKEAFALLGELVRQERIECEYRADGYYDVCSTPAGLQESREEADVLTSYGYTPEVVDGEELRRREPAMGPDPIGGVYYPEAATLDPGLFVTRLAGVTRRDGVEIREGVGARSVATQGGRATGVRLDAGGIEECDAVVLATGPYSLKMARRVGVRLPVQPGKGYHRDIAIGPNGAPRLRIACVLNESAVFCTPLYTFVRFAGTMEFSGVNRVMRPPRLRQLTRAARQTFPGLGTARPSSEWCGLRPMSVDGLPIVGPLGGVDGLSVATGHGMLGLTLAPVTGEIIANLVLDGGDPRIEALSPARFS